MPRITRLTALEILDSRGRPTVQATCELSGGASATVSVPSGASTGRSEAQELRDGDHPSRYRGLGCRRAVANVVDVIQPALIGHYLEDQSALDQTLIALDGTPNKSRLGANAILAVSLAFARAVAMERGIPLYQHFAEMLGQPITKMPQLTVNLFSGGKHAGGQVPIQDVLVVPVAATTVDEALATVFSVYQAAAELTLAKYGSRALTADEGGLAPPFPDVESMLGDAVLAIQQAGHEPGKQVALAVDVASSHFYRDRRYHLGTLALTSSEMIDQIDHWCTAYPIISVEDGLAEDDWDAWPGLLERLTGRFNAKPQAANTGGRAIVLGDDLLCTHPGRIRRAIAAGSANALLLKVNQIGSLTEALEALRLARSAGWHVTVSARSGETEDDWLADLAVGWGGDQIKVGSITHSERLAKYNRLLQIEASLTKTSSLTEYPLA
jgi:enolase